MVKHSLNNTVQCNKIAKKKKKSTKEWAFKRRTNIQSIVRGYENQLSVAKGWRADYIRTYGNYWAARLSYRTAVLGEDISFCKHNDVFQHGGKPVTIATRVILGMTDSVEGQWGQSRRAHSHPEKIRGTKRKAEWECVRARGWKRQREIKTQTDKGQVRGLYNNE